MYSPADIFSRGNLDVFGLVTYVAGYLIPSRLEALALSLSLGNRGADRNMRTSLPPATAGAAAKQSKAPSERILTWTTCLHRRTSMTISLTALKPRGGGGKTLGGSGR